LTPARAIGHHVVEDMRPTACAPYDPFCLIGKYGLVYPSVGCLKHPDKKRWRHHDSG
jgi:hypothetical protein